MKQWALGDDEHKIRSPLTASTLKTPSNADGVYGLTDTLKRVYDAGTILVHSKARAQAIGHANQTDPVHFQG